MSESASPTRSAESEALRARNEELEAAAAQLAREKEVLQQMLFANVVGLSPEKDKAPPAARMNPAVTATVAAAAAALSLDESVAPGSPRTSKEKRDKRHHTSIDAREVQTATVRALSKSSSQRRARSRSNVDPREVSAATSAVETLATSSRLYAAPRKRAESANAPRIPLTAAQKRARNKSSVNPREVNTAVRTSLTKKADRRARSQSAINPADVRAAKESRPHPFLSKSSRKSIAGGTYSPKSGSSPLGSPMLSKKGSPANNTAAARGRQRLSKHEQRKHPLLGRSASTNSTGSRRRKLPEAPGVGGGGVDGEDGEEGEGMYDDYDVDGAGASALTARSVSAPDVMVVPKRLSSSGGGGAAAAGNGAPEGVEEELWSVLNTKGDGQGDGDGDGDFDGDDGAVAVAAAAAAAAAATATTFAGARRKKKRPGALAGKKKKKAVAANDVASAVAGLRLDDFDDDGGSSTHDDEGDIDDTNYDDDDGSAGAGAGAAAAAVDFEMPMSPLASHAPEGEWEGAFDEDELEAAQEAAAAAVTAAAALPPARIAAAAASSTTAARSSPLTTIPTTLVSPPRRVSVPPINLQSDLQSAAVAAVAAANAGAGAGAGVPSPTRRTAASGVPRSPQLLGDDDIAAIMAPPAPTTLPAPPTPLNAMPPAPDGFMDSPRTGAAPPPGFDAALNGAVAEKEAAAAAAAREEAEREELDGEIAEDEEEAFDILSLVRAPVVATLTPEQAARQAKLARARAMQAERDATGEDVNEQMKRLMATSKVASETAARQLVRGANSGVASRKAGK